MNAYQSFKLFISLREHFTRKGYDYFEKRGKCFMNTPEKFQLVKEHDKRLYEKFARTYPDSLRNFYVANFTANSSIKWIGSLDSSGNYDIYMDFEKFRQAPTRYFKNSVTEIENYCYNNNVSFKNYLLSDRIWQLTDVHTRHIINKLTKFTERLAPKQYRKDIMVMEKYGKFVSINSIEEYGSILKEKIENLKN